MQYAHPEIDSFVNLSKYILLKKARILVEGTELKSEEIAKPENYSDGKKISSLIAEKEDIEKKISGMEERWMEISEEIENGKNT